MSKSKEKSIDGIYEKEMFYDLDKAVEIVKDASVVKFDETDISTEYSSLTSVVVRSKNWKIKLPINEPAEGLKKSQIEEYLDSNQGPGVQHIALLTGDIVSSIQALRENGVDFLDVPDTYYDNLRDRIGDVDEDIEKLRSLKILVDRDEEARGKDSGPTQEHKNLNENVNKEQETAAATG